MPKLIFVALALLCSLSLPGALHGQSGVEWNPSGLIMNRAELEELLVRLNSVANSSGYSGRIRENARRDADLIQERLDAGDFRLGDAVRIIVEGETEIPPELPVEPGPRITFPTIGPISLRGVLRSELEDHLTAELSRFIQNPIVRAEALIRISVQGSVGSPGFYVLPANMLVGEALMSAGGVGQAADLEELYIERQGEPLFDGEEMRSVLAEGRTLDQLNLNGGDQIVLPAQQSQGFFSTGWGQVVRWGAGIAVSVLFGYGVFY